MRMAFGLLGLLLLIPGQTAGENLKLASATEGTIDRLVLVTTAPAACAAVSDTAGLLAIGHRTGEAHVSLFALNDQGQLATDAPLTLTLPTPAAFEQKNHPLCLVFHPKKPLLYVWQDVEIKQTGVAPDANGLKLNHLLIYDVAKSPPALVRELARGAEYAIDNQAGAIALSRSAGRLYVPNLILDPAKPTTAASLGYFNLDAEGLPVDADQKPTDKLAFRITKPNWALSGFPCGMSYLTLENDAVVTTNSIGTVTWNENNAASPFNAVMQRSFLGKYYNDRLAAHSTLPMLYGSGLGTNETWCMEHVGGFPTLTAQRATIERASLTTGPLVLSKRNQVALAGSDRVYVLDLNDRGRFKATLMRTRAPKAAAIAYSPRFDTLYVAVEKVK